MPNKVIFNYSSNKTWLDISGRDGHKMSMSDIVS